MCDIPEYTIFGDFAFGYVRALNASGSLYADFLVFGFFGFLDILEYPAAAGAGPAQARSTNIKQTKRTQKIQQTCKKLHQT